MINQTGSDLDESYDSYVEYADNGISNESVDIEEITSSKQSYVTADQHFGHYNIINYCDRPFDTLDDMNETLLESWNSMIRPKDTVYFLGDLAFGKNVKTDYWLEQVNGNIIFFGGNHDASQTIDFFNCAIVKFGGSPFYLTHNPDSIPDFWRGWVIHGHHHNNILDRYPFINHKQKTVNVSVELTGYAPVNINTILQLINGHC